MLVMRHTCSGSRICHWNPPPICATVKIENSLGHTAPLPTGNTPWPLYGPTGLSPMQTLPKPTRLFFACADCSGTSVNVSVTATHDGETRPWVWHAVFPGTGEPPAEMLGSSAHFAEIEPHIRDKVKRLKTLTGVLEKSDEGVVAGNPNATTLAK